MWHTVWLRLICQDVVSWEIMVPLITCISLPYKFTVYIFIESNKSDNFIIDRIYTG